MYAVVKHSCYELCGYNAVVMNTVIETMLLCVLWLKHCCYVCCGENTRVMNAVVITLLL